jgi:hypothetical protein
MDILSTYYFNIEKHISIHNSSLLPNSEQQLKLFFDPSCPLCYPNLIPHSSNLNSSNREGKMLIQIEKLLILRPTKDRLWKVLSLVDDLIYLSCDISTELRNLKSKILNSLDEHYL